MTLSEQLREMEVYGTDQFPLLAEKVRRARKAILRQYIRDGKPLGDSPQAAYAYADAMYMAWVTARQAALQGVQHDLEELEAVGDLVRVADGYRVSPKGLARSLILTLHLSVNQADVEQRGLQEPDIIALKHMLLVVLSELDHVPAA